MAYEFSVLANFKIDSEERLKRLKDSFNSFYKANINSWHINVRGEFKDEVKKFLTDKNISKLNISHLESKNGWFSDTSEIVKNIDSKIIFCWIEDHISIKDVRIINSCVKEMHENNVDHLVYTFFHKGKIRNLLDFVTFEKKNFVSFFDLNLENYKKIEKEIKLKNLKYPYLVSLCSFISKDLLKKNLQISNSKKKYNNLLPFNFERSFFENEIIPFNAGFLNDELFVSIDDDHGEKGYSLISRNLYPNRMTKIEMDKIRSRGIKIYHSSILQKILNFFKF